MVLVAVSAERDGTAIHVDFFRVQVESPNDCENLRCKGFVQFDDVDVGESEAGERKRFGDGGDGADTHLFRQATRNSIGDKASEWLNAKLARAASSHEDYGCRAIGSLRRVSRGHGSLRMKHRPERSEGCSGGVTARAFVG